MQMFERFDEALDRPAERPAVSPNYPPGLVFAVIDPPRGLGQHDLRQALRAMTEDWSRYGYRGEIVNAGGVDDALERAVLGGARWCLLQRYGHVLAERLPGPRSRGGTVDRELAKWIEGHEFLVMGDIVGTTGGSFGLADRFLLVDVHRWVELGQPRYGTVAGERPSRPQAACVETSLPDGSRCLTASGGPPRAPHPLAPGWELIDSSLRAGLPVYETPSQIADQTVDVWPRTEAEANCLRRNLRTGIRGFPRPADEVLGAPQRRFFDEVATQMNNARRGVFLFNIESTDDLNRLPPGFCGPLRALYTVAAGFKPNAILRRLQFDDATRVVFFDYSPNALAVRETLRSRWNGKDLPAFMRTLFRLHPHPSTHYQLWTDSSAENIDWHDIDARWESELEQWGGEAEFQECWQRYQRLDHEYTVCDVLSDPRPLLRRVRSDVEPGAIWWSNAFFTVYGNWIHSEAERRRRYERWIDGLTASAPQLWIYGSDHLNRSVNHIQTETYQRLLATSADAGSEELCEIRT